MRVKFLAQGNSGSFRWESNSCLTIIQGLQVGHTKPHSHAALVNVRHTKPHSHAALVNVKMACRLIWGKNLIAKTRNMEAC